MAEVILKPKKMKKGKKKKSTKIELEPDQAAMVFTQGKIPIIFIPEGDDPDESVQDHVLLCVKLAVAITDPECVDVINRRFDEICDEEDESE